MDRLSRRISERSIRKPSPPRERPTISVPIPIPITEESGHTSSVSTPASSHRLRYSENNAIPDPRRVESPGRPKGRTSSTPERSPRSDEKEDSEEVKQRRSRRRYGKLFTEKEIEQISAFGKKGTSDV